MWVQESRGHQVHNVTDEETGSEKSVSLNLVDIKGSWNPDLLIPNPILFIFDKFSKN